MRTHQLVILPLAALALAACRDGAAAPTAAAGSAAVAAVGTARPVATRLSSGSLTLPPIGGFSSQLISRGRFVDPLDVTLRRKGHHGTTVVHVNEPSDMVMAQITIAPNSSLPWHSHPGPALVTVKGGALTIVDGESCEVRTYATGASFMDPGQGHVHIGFNAGAVDAVVTVTYLGVPAGQSPLMPTTNPGC